ncbi:MAG: DNA-binding transcriptional LysR family regulator [Parasphingorhabdus sp.]|jgi:DNA-binding transcriptional LysR family regulator
MNTGSIDRAREEIIYCYKSDNIIFFNFTISFQAIIMDRIQTLEMFVAVADRGSFSAAARALRVSPPAVTRGIGALEHRLGVSLFHRSTRAVSLTDDGSAFLPRARRILADIQDAERQVSGARSEPRGQFYVTAPVMFGRLHVLPVIGTMLEQHEQLDIRMMLVDRNVRIVEEGIDVAVRIGMLVDSSLLAVPIGFVRQKLVASPAYLARHGHPDKPSDLTRHRTIGTTGPRAAGEWRLDQEPVKLRPRLLLNTVDSAIAAAEAGLGIANLLSYQVEGSIRQGKLIEVMGSAKPKLLPINLLFEGARRSLPATRIFIDGMKSRAADQGLTRSHDPQKV